MLSGILHGSHGWSNPFIPPVSNAELFANAPLPFMKTSESWQNAAPVEGRDGMLSRVKAVVSGCTGFAKTRLVAA